MIHDELLRLLLSAFSIESFSDSHLQVMHHSHRVSDYIAGFSRYLSYDEALCRRLVQLAKYHDVGKYGVPPLILSKPERLTHEEYEIMKMHSIHGSHYVTAVDSLAYLSSLIKSHHERWDGTGYPDGLAQDSIPLESRLLAIVDAYDAMTGDRCYRKSLSKVDALKEIARCAGTQFDPHYAKLFVKFICQSEAVDFHKHQLRVPETSSI